MKWLSRCITSVTLAFLSCITHAETITFDGNDVEASGVFTVKGDGAYLVSDLRGVFPSTVFSWCAEACGALQTVTLKRTNGAAFGLSSVDVAALWTAGDNNPIVASGTLVAGGLVTQNLSLPGAANLLQTFLLSGFGNVTEVRFSKRDTSSFTDMNDFDAAIDNLVVSLNGISADPDSDGDGIVDTLDQCPSTPNNTQVNAEGCPDRDGDGIADTDDAFPDDPLNNAGPDGDLDGDGVKNSADLCADTPVGLQVNAEGCPDRDGDGIADTDDAFPDDASESGDSDGDGAGDRGDYCPGTAVGVQVNAQGCLDTDGDGVADIDDPFPNDPLDNSGPDGDLDGDGVNNSDDVCLGTSTGAPVNTDGCPDADGDGVADADDAFPNDASETADSDGDGVGDVSDQCAGTPGIEAVNGAGCTDSDGDGVADTDDPFPNDPFDNTGPDGDADGDGISNAVDACPGTSGTAVTTEGCPDADGDGVADADDAFPNNADETADNDGDGVGDASDPYPNAITEKASGAVGVAIVPTSSTSSCSVTTVRDEAPTVTNRPNAGYVSPSQVFFVLSGCAPGERVRVTIELADGIPRDPQVYKVDVAAKRWKRLPGAEVDIANKTVSYDLVDNGDLDSDPTPGVIVDPVVVLGSGAPVSLTGPVSVPLPGFVLWLLAMFVGGLGAWRIRVREAMMPKGAKV